MRNSIRKKLKFAWWIISALPHWMAWLSFELTSVFLYKVAHTVSNCADRLEETLDDRKDRFWSKYDEKGT